MVTEIISLLVVGFVLLVMALSAVAILAEVIGTVLEVDRKNLAVATGLFLALATVVIGFAFPGVPDKAVGLLARLPGADEEFLRSVLVGWGGVVLLVGLVGFLLTRWARALMERLVAFLSWARANVSLTSVTIVLLGILITALLVARAFGIVK